jgi:hypothetical protein
MTLFEVKRIEAKSRISAESSVVVESHRLDPFGNIAMFRDIAFVNVPDASRKQPWISITKYRYSVIFAMCLDRHGGKLYRVLRLAAGYVTRRSIISILESIYNLKTFSRRLTT